MLADLVVETFMRTDAAGTRRGARVRWQNEPDLEVVVRWHYRADPAPWGPWSQSERLRGAAYELFPAAPGRYEFQVFDQTPLRTVADNGYFELAVPALLESELELPKPSGLELVGPNGELLGSARTFTGRDLRLRWNAVRLDALYTDGAGEAPQDDLLELLELLVVGPAGETLRRVPLPINVGEWLYSYAQNAEDQPLTIDPASAVRDVRLELRWQDKLGRVSFPAVLEVEHTLQLSATADIETSAVTAVTEVADITESADFEGVAEDTYTLMAEVEVTGQGYPVSVQYTDRIFWATSFTGTDSTDAYFYLACRLRVIDEDDVVIASAEHRCFEQWTGWGQIFNITYSHPDVSVDAELELDVDYRLQAHYIWHREDTTRTLEATSFERRFRVTDLKR